MKSILHNSQYEVVRFSQGEDVVGGLLQLAEKNKIKGAWFWAIGSAKEVELAFYDLQQKKYLNKKFSEPLEILSSQGSLGTKSGRPVVHWHGLFGRFDYSVIGGHIHQLIANATVEVFIQKMNSSLTREFDSQTGLNLLQ